MADIKEKIRKLLALAGSPNENEARDALLKARELMAKNKLSEADISDKDCKLSKLLCDDIRWTTDSGRIWMTTLCQTLCDNYCCSCAWYCEKGRRTYRLVIIGLGEDAEICKTAVEYAVEFVNSAIDRMQRKYSRQDPKAIADSYARGFIVGLKLAFESQKDEHPEWGLVVVKPDELNDYEKSLGSKSVKACKPNFDALAYTRGQVDGKNFNPYKVLT